MSEDDELAAFYRRYIGRCNAHDFDALAGFVDAEVEVNGERQGLEGYRAGLQAVVHAFPDYRWEVRHLFVRDRWVSAHFVDTGTHGGAFLGVPATGRRVSTQEFAVYRVTGGKIVEVWVVADNLGLLEQLR